MLLAEITLDAVLKIAQILVTIVFALVAAWIRSAIGRINDRQGVMETRIAKVEGAVEQKVSDEEWIRESMRLRNSVEDQGKTLARIEGKTDATLQVAAAVGELAKAMQKAQTTQEANGG